VLELFIKKSIDIVGFTLKTSSVLRYHCDTFNNSISS
jgi:hypothetical protein